MYITMGFKSAKKLKELKLQNSEEAKSVFGTYAQEGLLDKTSFGELISKQVRSPTKLRVDVGRVCWTHLQGSWDLLSAAGTPL